MVSENVSILFRLDQRSHDMVSNSSMNTIMEFIASYLNCNVLTFKYKVMKSSEQREVLSLSITSVNKLKPIIEYFNNYPLLGTKYLDFKDWTNILELQKANPQTTSYLEIAINTRKNFNSTRTTYNWNHLKNCYIN